jgi:V/A-type H+/Na+-transporting ATPase subunit E
LSPLKDLLASIEVEAKQESERLEAESRAEAESILAEAREKAQETREEVLRSWEAEAEAEAERRIARARLEAMNTLRAAREQAFEQLLAEVRSRLGALRGELGYREALRALLRETLAALPDARLVRVDSRDEELAAELVRESGADLAVEASLETLGGLVLESDDGRLARNTFEERLANAEGRLRLWYGRRVSELTGEGR